MIECYIISFSHVTGRGLAWLHPGVRVVPCEHTYVGRGAAAELLGDLHASPGLGVLDPP